MKTLLLASLLVVPTLKNVSVSTEVVIKNTTTSLNDLQVIATDLATGEEIAADQDGTLNLPEGAYHLSGKSNFCFLVEQDALITAETPSLKLDAVCE